MYNYGINTMQNTQPYGYQNTYGMYYNNTMQQPSNLQQTIQANTNEIFVNGYEDVRNRQLPPNSNYIFLDNDKALLYEKIVDSKGQFEVKVYEIREKTNLKDEKQPNIVDLSMFVKTDEFSAFKEEIKTRLDFIASKGVEDGKSDNEK